MSDPNPYVLPGSNPSRPKSGLATRLLFPVLSAMAGGMIGWKLIDLLMGPFEVDYVYAGLGGIAGLGVVSLFRSMTARR